MNFKELEELKQLSEELQAEKIALTIITCIKNIILIASYTWLCSVIIDSIFSVKNSFDIILTLMSFIFSVKNCIIMIILASAIKFMISWQKNAYAGKEDTIEKIKKFFLNNSR